VTVPALAQRNALACPGGPLLVRGGGAIDDDGDVHENARPVGALCRCGHSSSAPWCDATHKVALARRPAPGDAPVEPGPRTTEFGGLRIDYDHRVLEPRTWTAAQSRWAASLLGELPPGPVLELCSGAGHIGLLAVSRHDRELIQVDADPVACSYARHNADANGLGSRVTVRCGHMQDVIARDESFALVVADPPWVPTDLVTTYPADPRLAIDGGPSGTDLVHACLAVIGAHLVGGGAAVLQVGPEQTDAVAAHLAGHPSLGLDVEGHRWHARGALVLLRRRG
jgi:methylase of polypeptide subunit release factors